MTAEITNFAAANKMTLTDVGTENEHYILGGGDLDNHVFHLWVDGSASARVDGVMRSGTNATRTWKDVWAAYQRGMATSRKRIGVSFARSF